MHKQRLCNFIDWRETLPGSGNLSLFDSVRRELFGAIKQFYHVILARP